MRFLDLFQDSLYHYISENSWKAVTITVQSAKSRDFVSELAKYTSIRLYSINRLSKDYEDIINEQRDFMLIIAYIQNNKEEKALRLFNDMLWEARKRFIYFLFGDEVYIEVR